MGYECNGLHGKNGPLTCLSPFAVMCVDKGHLFCFRVSKLPCCILLIPSKRSDTWVILPERICISSALCRLQFECCWALYYDACRAWITWPNRDNFRWIIFGRGNRPRLVVKTMYSTRSANIKKNSEKHGFSCFS